MYLSQNDIARRIQIIMNELAVTQNQLAAMLEVTQPAISKYLQGRVPPPFVLLELSKLSGRSMEWILTGDEQLQLKFKKVAENKSSYFTGDSINRKIDRLPFEIRKKIEALIDSIIQGL